MLTLNVKITLEELVCDGGTPVADCSCGRTHYTGSGAYMEPGELEELEAKRAKDPKKYVRDEYGDSISIGSLDGIMFVYGCECRRIEKYERFIWNNRSLIMDFIRQKAEQQKREAEKTLSQHG